MNRGKYRCEICNKEVTNSSIYIRLHLDKHVRNGELQTKKESDGTTSYVAKNNKVIRVTTTKKSQSYSLPSGLQHGRPRISNFEMPVRQPITYRKDKDGKVKVRCSKCHKWVCASSFIDERFIKGTCCKQIMLLPIRLAAKASVDKELEY